MSPYSGGSDFDLISVHFVAVVVQFELKNSNSAQKAVFLLFPLFNLFLLLFENRYKKRTSYFLLCFYFYSLILGLIFSFFHNTHLLFFFLNFSILFHSFSSNWDYVELNRSMTQPTRSAPSNSFLSMSKIQLQMFFQFLQSVKSTWLMFCNKAWLSLSFDSSASSAYLKECTKKFQKLFMTSQRASFWLHFQFCKQSK